MKKALVGVAVLAITFATVTWWALESGGVAVLETRDPTDSPRQTHVWYVEADGQLWLEAGTPDNAWFRDIEDNPELILTAGGRSSKYVAEPVAGRPAHEHIRSLMRDKYGWRDRWVSLLFETSESVAVRLAPPTPRES